MLQILVLYQDYKYQVLEWIKRHKFMTVFLVIYSYIILTIILNLTGGAEWILERKSER